MCVCVAYFWEIIISYFYGVGTFQRRAVFIIFFIHFIFHSSLSVLNNNEIYNFFVAHYCWLVAGCIVLIPTPKKNTTNKNTKFTIHKNKINNKKTCFYHVCKFLRRNGK